MNWLARPLCWWFGCRPDFHAQPYGDAVPCDRCGAWDTSYEDRIGYTRHNRLKEWLAYWLWRKWIPVKCRACNQRFGHDPDCDGIPF